MKITRTDNLVPKLSSGSLKTDEVPFVTTAVHVAAVSVPRLHEDVPDTVYPELHVG